VVAILYGLAIEVVQHYFIPGRSFELTDLLADAIGSCMGAAIWRAYIKK